MKQFHKIIFLTALLNLAACPGTKGPDMSWLVILGLGPTPPAPTYTVGGTVTGLSGGQNVTIQLNGSETVLVSTNSSFTFTTKLNESASYSVLTTAATGTNCMASANSGTLASSNVTNVAVACSTTTRLLSVSVTGPLFTGSAVVFQNNGTNNLTVTGTGAAPGDSPKTGSFSTQVLSGRVTMSL